MKPWLVLRAAFGVVLTVSLTWALDTKLGPAPPLGRFLSPFQGFWRNMESGALPAEPANLHVPGLLAPVQVVFDERRVPHVFAQNDHDLYLAQGYLTARDRLWQMEFQTRVAAGRVSEIVGEKALGLDKYNRRIGLAEGARRAATMMLADTLTQPIVEAYCAGVNARIQELTSATLPFEYKLLDYRPEPWTPLHCGLLLKLMALDLTGKSDDYRMSNVRQKLGAAATADLFPLYPSREDPIIPLGTPLDFQPLKMPVAPAEALVPTAPGAAHTGQPAPAVTAFDISLEEQAAIGSNNWAVDGARSASGYPLLANDPHLALNLPSLWYQMQLSAPGHNACGATLPGSPAVISGFNQRTAWGVTNVGADVLDYYQITFVDAARTRYRWDGAERTAELKIERIKVRGQADILDTVRWTHLGPIVRDRLADTPFNPQVPPGCAMRWTAHDPANELRAFCDLNRAASYADYVAALSHYACPAQNFVFAALKGADSSDIAIWPNGRFPLKYPGQGRFVLTQAQTAEEWAGWLPHAHNPHVRNPARGFVSSANQNSTAPDYPYYLGADFANYARGHRINEVLAADARATPESMRALQNDVVGVNARDLLPTLLPLLADGEKLSAAEAEAYKLLQAWTDYGYHAAAPQPAIWEVWYGLLQKAIWDDELGTDPQNLAAAPLRYPARDRTRRLLAEQADTTRWFDNVTTADHRETRAEVVRTSFKATIDSLQKHLGAAPSTWQWAKQKGTDIKHVALLPGFGFDDVVCGGGAGIVNATSERAGPSWRMVVALDPKRPRGWGVYPGGQSGNPGSPYYADQLEYWRTGQLYPLLYLLSATEVSPRIAGRAVLQ
jgi:penicillin G amidase